MLIDGHVHFFDHRIIDNVAKRSAMVAELGLETDRARRRIGRAALEAAGRRAGLDRCLLLPTAGAARVREANTEALALAAENGFIRAAGTLHPESGDIAGELRRLHAGGIRAIKLSSFSQGFSPASAAAQNMMETVEAFNRKENAGFFLVMDTFCKAEEYFGAPAAHLTTPEALARRVRTFPGIVFVAAHMGGLCAPTEQIASHLPPAPNLYLDTANAAHTLSATDSCRLLCRHGPDRIIFGTDWPWFDPREETKRIEALLDRAGFSREEKGRVLGGNMARLLGLEPFPGAEATRISGSLPQR